MTASLVAVGITGLLPAVTGGLKLAAVPAMRARAAHLGFSVRAFRVLGALELAGVAGLAVGLFAAPIGVAAAVGLTAMMVGAVVCHLRAGDPPAATVPALVVAALLAVVIALLAGVV
ncbi:DoxX family protein [Actinokineospora sp. PR83]|uniref:DoxX family protein n=1 Tax=Actinokineospora sp. PR83 TaxID=2884908 RepID=UPI0027E03169|nr:DoxX family protein [Actinokineospora sp. PR83]MCG8914513.1 DoxX family protein [Actinokineospora sp. PR83]